MKCGVLFKDIVLQFKLTDESEVGNHVISVLPCCWVVPGPRRKQDPAEWHDDVSVVYCSNLFLISYCSLFLILSVSL